MIPLLLLGAALAVDVAPGPSPVSLAKVPDPLLTAQDGRQLHLYSDLIQDRIVAVNFMFTTCPSICPPMGAIFGQLQDLVAKNPDILLISVSIDPVTDTPQRMAAWGAQFHAGPRWFLLTGKSADIDDALRTFGVYGAVRGEHSPVVILGNAKAGRWLKADGLSAPEELARLLAELSAPKPKEGAR